DSNAAWPISRAASRSDSYASSPGGLCDLTVSLLDLLCTPPPNISMTSGLLELLPISIVSTNTRTDTGLTIRVDDLAGPEIAAFLEEHINDMRSVSPPESK